MPKLELVESARGPVNGLRWKARIIEADRWGSTAYYPREVLERDGPRVFTTGVQVFENHMTDNEKWERPEGNVQNLIGKLISEASFEDDGLYADIEFYPSYADRINEIAGDIGLSVRASGLTEDAEMDGRYGPVLVALLAAESVDVVTKAGAGGKLTSILESGRGLAGRPVDEKGTQSMTDVTKEDFEALSASVVGAIENLATTLTESLAAAAPAPVEVEVTVEGEEVVEAEAPVEIDHVAVVEALRTNNLPAVATAAIIAALKEGKTLEEAVKAQVELREAFTATGAESGTVVISESGGKKTGLARAVEVLG